MLELFFRWVGLDGTVCVLNVSIFVTEKSITFKRTKIRLTSPYEKDRYFVV